MTLLAPALEISEVLPTFRFFGQDMYDWKVLAPPVTLGIQKKREKTHLP
jgi:hypothetical protein